MLIVGLQEAQDSRAKGAGEALVILAWRSRDCKEDETTLAVGEAALLLNSSCLVSDRVRL